MLVAESHWTLGERGMDTIVFLAPGLHALYARRHRLLFDTRFAAPLGAPRADLATLLLVSEGHVQTSGGARYDSPAIWLLRDDELEHPAPGAPSLRSWGAPVTLMTIRVPTSALTHLPGIEHGPHPMTDSVRDAMDALGAAREVEAQRASFRATLDALAAGGLLTPALDALLPPAPSHLARVWSVLSSLYAVEDTSSTIDQISSLTRLSWRQAHRDLEELSHSVGFAGFRATTRALRLRRAITLLSAVEVTLEDVAKRVGYGSLDAMGRAFRDAGLPSPGGVREAVAYPDEPER